MIDDEDPYDWYPAEAMNFDQYSEFRDKYYPPGEDVGKNEVPRSVLIDIASKLQISSTINKAKCANGNRSTFEYLELSANTIGQEIATVLSAGDHSVEGKLDSTIYKDDGKIRVAGLKGDVYLNDSFFEFKFKPPQQRNVHPKGSRSSENLEHPLCSKENALLVQNICDDEIYQRDIVRYAEPIIGVLGQCESPQFKTAITLNSYLDFAFETQKKKQIKSKKASRSKRR